MNSAPSITEIRRILENQDPKFLEDLAAKACGLTRQYFGRAISLYTPLYLSNYCASHCTYCGFHSHNKILRIKLKDEEIHEEMQAISRMGVQNILMLTGESPQATPVDYLVNATHIARKYFQGIAFEIYPMDIDGYRTLFEAGVDGVTIYQETYDRETYAKVHLAGQKKDCDYRLDAPERIAQAGMRQISLGILLGLGPVVEDLHSLYSHLRGMEKKFPGVEYSISFPRMRTIKKESFATGLVDDIAFVKILCLTRVLFPRIGINLSTRESAAMRQRCLELCVTRISVGSRTAVKGYTSQDEGDPQFDICDERSAQEIISSLKLQDFDPVFTDWRNIAHA